MFVIGIFVHIVFLFSIFDVYFKSPIVRNVTPYKPLHEEVADRLVLFVVDGLRAESFVNYTTMTYLRSIANTKGRWGISQTRMPTESRPGHVAVIAGFYEDPSAVVKGWKENPVDFDSVFNQSTFTWCWGTYDIVEIFAKGIVDNHIFVKKMDPYDQTFSTDKNTTHLDAWVFDNVKNFFHDAQYDNTLNEKLHQKKVIFFLHLLGTDTSGHTHKPKSPNFLTTIKFVDEGIKEIEEIIRNFYNDDKTTFLMTSDHGMTDWGSHGAGLNHETQTPYVIWGAGVHQVTGEMVDPETNSMSLDRRHDINQADLSPLMATILSIPVPVNSIGQLPSDLLNMSISNKAKAIYSNSRQLASQYNTKRLDVENGVIRMLYQPFEPFSENKYKEIIEFTEKLLTNINDSEQFEKLIILSKEIMNLSLSGLNYYHNYYQKPLLVLVTLSFIGWIVCLLKSLLQQKMNSQIETSNFQRNAFKVQTRTYLHLWNTAFTIILLGLFFIVYVQNLPMQYYIYIFMPVYLWLQALSPFDVWKQTFSQFQRNSQICSVWIEIICYIFGSLALGMSFTHRWLLSIPLFGMSLWPFFSSMKQHLTRPILLIWPVGCVLLSVFSFMPIVGKDTFIELVLAAGVIWLCVLMVYIWKVLLPLHNYENSKNEIMLTTLQALLLILSLHDIYVQSKRFDRGTPVSQIYQAFAWTIAVLSLISPLACSRTLICRLLAIDTAIINIYLLLSVSHEGLFMVAFTLNLSCWIFIEYRVLDLKKAKLIDFTFEDMEEVTKKFITIERGITNQDFRRSFFFTVYIILAFFGTGNIASLNSFEVRWVTCFITSFKPFIITGLVLLKTLSPFLLLACTFRGVQHLTKAPTGYLNIIVLVYSNIMGIQLLYNVKNTGSWLDIGTSISQFVIVQVITLFIVLINQIAKILTGVCIYRLAEIFFGKSIKKHV